MASSFVEVTVPMDLDAGYTFDAQGPDGNTFQVKVPPGGVKAGQRISVPYSGGSSAMDIPRGKWRNGLCDCCGSWCSAMCCMACCCNGCHLGQVMTRNNLNFCGHPTSRENAQNTCMYLSLFVFLTLLLTGGVGDIVVLVVLLVVGINARSYMRRKYDIPPGCCGCMDDCCCLCFCGCCTTIQMATHTHDHRQHPSACCTANGLTSRSPLLPQDV
mmetsp:Transcript_2985/g.4352  ORF Transcript_2985/g.4352 Transcript_2985/m.4352 type:complete len:215 (+) Transcript_2985:88-732(+)